ncbi:MAG: eukaryotic-like serine/threonine-protein kinase [Solirubrobacterales bacterium]|jgi:serine/threonine-protein kinase|nr:eukaryotic-like serine/threonine-protein kinase [Solirubrobacterales bacterium]
MNPLAPDILVGGRYRLVRRIGAGGMADVWCADDEMLNRRIALKFLLERYASDADFVERFRREAAAAAGLQHPNVVSVYDRGEHEGRPFIVMEYVEGASLKDLIDRGLTGGEAIEIIRQVLAGARFAHARGIVHRDLKPQNVLIDREGRARVADFGIARAGTSEITQTGSVLGTAQYLSPEQAQGLETTPASDLYSVGAMLYEALTGQVPFDADSPVAVALKQVSETPRPPSQINPHIPAALDAVVLKALAKEPANRYQTADEFSAALVAAEADPNATPGDTASYGAMPAPVAVSTTAPTQPPRTPADDAETVLAEEDEGFWTRNRMVAAGIALLLVIAAVLFLLLHDSGTKHVLVPNVLTETQDTATADLQAKGFQVVPSPIPSRKPLNTVIKQSPRAGTTADEGSTVTITVSTGLGKATVKDVRGLSVTAATKALAARGFKNVATTHVFSAADPGTVIGSEPPAGTLASRSKLITLKVSKGQNITTVPSVVGELQAQAQTDITAAGLKARVTQQSSALPAGQVIQQSPGGGAQARPGSVVAITVSNGQVLVPNVVGESESQAKSDLAANGLKNVNVVSQATTDQSQDGLVVKQAPPAGTKAATAGAVTIYVGKFSAPTTTSTTTPSTTSTTTTTTGGGN